MATSLLIASVGPTMTNSRIQYRNVPDIQSCYDVFLDGRPIGRVWQDRPNIWFARDMNHEHPLDGFMTRHDATMWLERKRRAEISPSRWKQKLAARNTALREGS
jgi:hypothetical protein